MIHWVACNVHIDSESAGTYCQLVFRRIRAVPGGCLPPHPLGRVRGTATYIESGRGGRISQLSRPFLRDATRVAVLAPGPMTVRALPAGGPPPSRDPDRTQRPRRSGTDTRRPTRRASRDSWDSQAPPSPSLGPCRAQSSARRRDTPSRRRASSLLRTCSRTPRRPPRARPIMLAARLSSGTQSRRWRRHGHGRTQRGPRSRASSARCRAWRSSSRSRIGPRFPPQSHVTRRGIG